MSRTRSPTRKGRRALQDDPGEDRAEALLGGEADQHCREGAADREGGGVDAGDPQRQHDHRDRRQQPEDEPGRPRRRRVEPAVEPRLQRAREPVDRGRADDDQHDHRPDPEPFAVAGGDLAPVRVDDQRRDQRQHRDAEPGQRAFRDAARLDLLAQPERGPGVGARLEQLARQFGTFGSGHQDRLPDENRCYARGFAPVTKLTRAGRRELHRASRRRAASARGRSPRGRAGPARSGNRGRGRPCRRSRPPRRPVARRGRSGRSRSSR